MFYINSRNQKYGFFHSKAVFLYFYGSCMLSFQFQILCGADYALLLCVPRKKFWIITQTFFTALRKFYILF